MGIGDLAKKAKDVAGDLADKAKDVSGDLAVKAKDVGGDLAEKSKVVAGKVAEDAREVTEIAKGEGSIGDKAKAALGAVKGSGDDKPGETPPQ